MPSDFSWPVRVYYEDTDAGGVVFYANYLKFFERARTEWLRARGIDQRNLANSHRVLFVVKNVAIDYHAPAQLDDELKLSVVVERMGSASVHFLQQAWRVAHGTTTLMASARVKVGCVGSADFRPCSMPEDIIEKLRPDL